MRDWAKARRDRTRHLIELGGLVQKAGLVELVDDDRATLLGAFMELADRLRGADETDPSHLVARWRRRGLRAFDADREAAALAIAPPGPGRPGRVKPRACVPPIGAMGSRGAAACDIVAILRG